jgi:hypothetical protein
LPSTHQYPTRQQQASQHEQAHHVITIQNDANRLETPNIPTYVHWANAIIDPSTGASMEY